MTEPDYTVDQIVKWLDEARELEDDGRQKMLFWKRVRQNLQARLDLKVDQMQVVGEVEKWLEQ